MSYENKYPNWEQMVLEASLSSESGAKAAATLGIKYDTYRKYAIKYGCFVTNQPGRGLTKDYSKAATPVEEILEGQHPHFKTSGLKKKLYKKGLKQPECEICGLGPIWNGKPITHHLDHIDGNARNHSLDNLQILCPNCHSQTDTYAGKNKASVGKR